MDNKDRPQRPVKDFGILLKNPNNTVIHDAALRLLNNSYENFLSSYNEDRIKDIALLSTHGETWAKLYGIVGRVDENDPRVVEALTAACDYFLNTDQGVDRIERQQLAHKIFYTGKQRNDNKHRTWGRRDTPISKINELIESGLKCSNKELYMNLCKIMALTEAPRSSHTYINETTSEGIDPVAIVTQLKSFALINHSNETNNHTDQKRVSANRQH